jgi:type IV pilus assembly protein PilB
LITSEQLETCLKIQKTEHKRLGSILVEQGYASELDVALSLATKLAIPYVDLTTTEIDPEAVSLVNEKLARRYQVFPFQLVDRTLTLAMSDPLDINAIEDVRFHTDMQVVPAVCLPRSIEKAISEHYHVSDKLQNLLGEIPESISVQVLSRQANRTDEKKLRRLAEALPVVRIVNLIFAEAVRSNASDIHLEPAENVVVVRTRINGLLKRRMTLPKWVQGAVVSRIKIMSQLDIAEKRLPQDGRLQLRIDKKDVDLRVSTLPAKHGEKVVIRVLHRTAVPSLTEIGLHRREIGAFREFANLPQGMVLVTGPTGSGKSTSLYAVLSEMKRGTLNIITLEDPIEYEVDGVSQVQISEKSGLSFAVGLRSVLRQDPDVILVGEMRDEETASVALKASLTGHLVFSTIHSNDSVSAVTRLNNMGIPPYLIGSALTAVVAQRLVRTICPHCMESYVPDAEELAGLDTAIAAALNVQEESAGPAVVPLTEEDRGLKQWVESLLDFPPQGASKQFTLYHGRGCGSCSGTGYAGRTGVFELLRVTPSVRELIFRGASEDKIRKAAEDAGMESLLQGACRKLLSGLTTVEEVIRVMATDSGDRIPCAGCKTPLETDFAACPRCGLASRPSCSSCGRRCEAEWKFCPYCRKPMQSALRAPSRFA